MRDPSEMPANSVHRFVCVNAETGHVRNEKVMTAAHAELINTYNHMQDCGYKWLWDDQYSFEDQLDYDTALVVKV